MRQVLRIICFMSIVMIVDKTCAMASSDEMPELGRVRMGSLELPTGEIVRLRVSDTIHTPLKAELKERLYKAGFRHLVDNSSIVRCLAERNIWPQQAFDCMEMELKKYYTQDLFAQELMEIHKSTLIRAIFHQDYILEALEAAGYLQEEVVEAPLIQEKGDTIAGIAKELVIAVGCVAASSPFSSGICEIL